MVPRFVGLLCLAAAPLIAVAQDPAVRVEAPQLQGSRPVEKQTETAVVRDYLLSWKSFGSALDANRVDLLEGNFVGTAHDKLVSTIEQQAKLGIHTRYRDRSHDLQIVFYSPEGLSIQMVDNVEYEQQILEGDKVVASKPMRARYLVVLTPSEVRWRVRIFQAAAE